MYVHQFRIVPRITEHTVGVLCMHTTVDKNNVCALCELVYYLLCVSKWVFTGPVLVAVENSNNDTWYSK